MIASAKDFLYAAGCQDIHPVASQGDDLAFWMERARLHGSPVLELSCGTGRIAMALASQGHRVTAVDASEPLLRECRKAGQRRGIEVNWFRADLENFELETRFALILLPSNAAGMFLEPARLEMCLSNARRHLLPGGRLVLDAFCPSPETLINLVEEKRPVLEYEDRNWNGTVVVSQSSAYDAERQVNHVKMFFQFPGCKHELVEVRETRLYGRLEMEELLARCGLEVEERFGDFDGTPLATESSKQILVCSPA